MSNIQLIPVFGTSFVIYVPIIMILLSLITFFNGFSRFLKIIGVETVESTSRPCFSCRKIEIAEEDNERYKNGKALILREFKRLKINHNIITDNTSNMVTSVLHNNHLEKQSQTKSMNVKYKRSNNNEDNDDDLKTFTFNDIRHLSSLNQPGSEESKHETNQSNSSWKSLFGTKSDTKQIQMKPLINGTHNSSAAVTNVISNSKGFLSKNIKYDRVDDHSSIEAPNLTSITISKSIIKRENNTDFSLNEDDEEDFYGGRYSNV